MQAHSQAIETLRGIGHQLNRGQFPRVCDGGVVQPGDFVIDPSIPGGDSANVEERSESSEARPWARPSWGQMPPGEAGSASSSTSVVNSSLRDVYEAELADVYAAYPGVRIWKHEEGLWLQTESSVAIGLGKNATFLTAIPYSPKLVQKSWGFWRTPVSCEWIGPRHTNFPDGSVCAFEPRDGTWLPGDSIVALLDLYTLWALRHEHLRIFGQWPGSQSVPWPYERLVELKDDELCGCGKQGQVYLECCKRSDLARSRMLLFFEFRAMVGGQIDRKPPQEISEFMWNNYDPPLLSSYTRAPVGG